MLIKKLDEELSSLRSWGKRSLRIGGNRFLKSIDKASRYKCKWLIFFVILIKPNV